MFHGAIFTVRAVAASRVFVLWSNDSIYQPWSWSVSWGITAVSHSRKGVVIHPQRVDRGTLYCGCCVSTPHSEHCREANMAACTAFIWGLLLSCLSCLSQSSPSPVAQFLFLLWCSLLPGLLISSCFSCDVSLLALLSLPFLPSLWRNPS